MSQDRYDLAIIGAGPAGSSAAITAARAGLRVVLLEAGQFPRHKVCGEFVSAESHALLSSLIGISPAGSSALQNAQIISGFRLFLGRRHLAAPIAPPALSLPRIVLDQLLWSEAASSGACTMDGAQVTSLAGTGPFQLRSTKGEFAATAVIMAAGRWSRFTDKTVPMADPKWIGVKRHFRERDPAASTDLYFFQDGYCGVQPIGRDEINVCAMVHSVRANSLEKVFPLNPALALRAEQWEPVSECVTTAPIFHSKPQPVRAGQLLVGDAAGFIDPFAGDGISIALRSGTLAANCLVSAFREGVALESAIEQYRQEYCRQFAPPIATAARVRRLLSLPALPLTLAFELMRLPGMLPAIVRKTRQSGVPMHGS